MNPQMLPETEQEIAEFLRAYDAGEIKFPPPSPPALIVKLVMQHERIKELEDLLTSANAISLRNGEGTHWVRYHERLVKANIGYITPKTFRVLPGDSENANCAATGSERKDHE